ncbi:acyl-CoA dehydrogenase family protein [Plantactinospora sp. DSM 117369]
MTSTMEVETAIAVLRDELADTAAIARAEAAGAIPDTLLDRLAAAGLLAWTGGLGGAGPSATDLGRYCEQLGYSWMSLLSVLTAHTMSVAAILRWGRGALGAWHPARSGSPYPLLSFALSEPDTGSDAHGITTLAEDVPGGYRVTGRKTWLSGGRRAAAFLVFARTADGPAALLVDRDTPGLRVTGIDGLLGFRAAMLAGVELDGCHVPEGNRVGRPGYGISHVAATALDHGRYCLAWGGVGLAQACLDASVAHTRTRHQFGVPLLDHQLVRRQVTDMMVDTTAARLLCAEAARLRDDRAPEALIHTAMAKYLAAGVAQRAAHAAVQLHGAIGCSGRSPVERYYRDAKVLELIEGSTEIHQVSIAEHAQRFSTPRTRTARRPLF